MVVVCRVGSGRCVSYLGDEAEGKKRGDRTLFDDVVEFAARDDGQGVFDERRAVGAVVVDEDLVAHGCSDRRLGNRGESLGICVCECGYRVAQVVVHFVGFGRIEFAIGTKHSDSG